jgi:ribonuclease BN (tRNA processing enzyme)
MQLTLLGTGTSQVSKKRVSPANHLKIADKSILVDCGCGTLIRLDQAGIPFKDIDVIFISHFHIDHISDLYSILWALKYPHLNRKKDLLIVGPIGFERFYNTYVKPIVFPKPFDLFNVNITEIKDKITFKDFNVEVNSTPHTAESIAYKFSANEKTLVIAGDMDYDGDLITFSKKADLLILECSFDNSMKVEGHLIPKECGEIAVKADVKQLIITHFYPIHKEVRLKETQAIFQNTIMAEDLLTIDL